MADEFEPPEHGPLRDSSIAWRLSLWGGAATVAVAAAVLVLNADLGLDRIVAALSQPAPKQVVAEDELFKRMEAQRIEETRRFEARIRELAADRDKLNSRLATLEQSFSDITGSIKRDLAAVSAAAPKPEAALKPQPAPMPAPVLSAPPATSAPVSAPPPKAEPAPQAQTPPAPEAPARAEAAPAQSPKVVPPQVVTVPMPPTRMAAATPGNPEEPRKAELGVDLGGARSLDILQARWVAVKANFGPLIDGLRPLAGFDDRPGIIPHRLIVGPLPNGAAAAQLCTRFAASKVPCRPVDYAGEKLAQ